MRCIQFGKPANQHTGCQSDENTDENTKIILRWQQQFGDEKGCYSDGCRGEINAFVEGKHQLFGICIFMCTHHIDADDGKQSSNAGQNHGCNHKIDAVAGKLWPQHGHCAHAQSRCSQDAACIAFIEVSPHAGDIAHVVSHVVCDGGRVASVIFGYTRFHFAHQVCSHVCRFGKDSTAQARKKRLSGCAHTKREHDHRDLLQWDSNAVEDVKPGRDVYQGKTNHREPGDAARSECYLQPLVEALRTGLSSAVGGQCSGIHADKTGQTAEEAASQKSPGNQGMQHLHYQSHKLKNDEGYDEKYRHTFILLFQVGKSSFSHKSGDLHHARRARILRLNLIEKDCCKGQSHYSSQGSKIPKNWDNFHKNLEIDLRINSIS